MFASASKKASTAIVWHRTDLRTDDNPSLTRAAELVSFGNVKSVLPVYVLQPSHFGITPFGSQKTGAYRAKFLLEALGDLKKRLRALGSDLLIAVGKPEEVLADLSKELKVSKVLTETLTTAEEASETKTVRKRLSSADVGFVEVPSGSTLYDARDLPFEVSSMPTVFTPFRKKVEDNCEIRTPKPPPAEGSLPLPAQAPENLDFVPAWEDLPYEERPEQPEAHPKSAFKLAGGEGPALKRLQHYLWDTDQVAKYFDVRNGMLGTEYSTKLSASLALGCISARRIASEVEQYEQERTKNKSTYWVVFELIWRDFFRFAAQRYGNAIFRIGGPAKVKRDWAMDEEKLERWKNGTTGWPLVDANMRELKETGWMSNRGRQIVASYFALELGLDWRYGADHFESLLLDYDVASNWGNWNSAAVLTGGRVNRFNVIKQGRDYDWEGRYVRTWVPELEGFQGMSAHEPWKGTKPSDYPDRIQSNPQNFALDDRRSSRKAPQPRKPRRKSKLRRV